MDLEICTLPAFAVWHVGTGVTPGTYKVIWHINVAPSVGAVVTVFFDAIATACRDGKSYPRTDVQLRELTYPKEAPEKHAYRPCVVKAPGTLAAVEPHEGLASVCMRPCVYDRVSKKAKRIQAYASTLPSP